MRKRHPVYVTVISNRKLVMILLSPIIIVFLPIICFIMWAFIPTNYPGIMVREKAQIRYNLSPYSNAHAVVDKHAGCILLDGSVYHIDGDPFDYYYVNCDGRIGYADGRYLIFN